MSHLEKLVHNSYPFLFGIDEEGSIYDDPIYMTYQLSSRIVDETTLFAIDISDLFDATNHTQTKTGAATLFRSLVQPLDSLELIHEKQNSVKELEKDVKMRKEFNGYISSLAKRERYLHWYFFGCRYCKSEPHDVGYIDQYKMYRESMEFFKDMVNGAKDLPSPQSQYLKILVDDIRNIDGTRVFEFIKGPVYKTFGGLKPRKEVRVYTPRIKFTLRPFKPTLLIGYAALLLPFFFTDEPVGAVAPVILIPIAGWSAFFMEYPRVFDRKHFVSPLKEMYKKDSNVWKGIDALGKIDELLSFYEYSKAMGESMVLPTVNRADQHFFVAKNVRNPILAKGNPDYVPNDVNLDGKTLTIITGSNSGGKTTYCKTIAQMQILAQIGCYVPAEEAELSIADNILYQVPMSDSISDTEGRFGTELKRTSDIFFKATPRSLVVLDELAEATTHEEKMEISYAILNGFKTIGSDTILVTHNIELANRFLQEGRCQHLQVEFKNKKPTYKLIPGISKKSHAELVAEKIGFSPTDIRAYLKRKGYVKKNARAKPTFE